MEDEYRQAKAHEEVLVQSPISSTSPTEVTEATPPPSSNGEEKKKSSSTGSSGKKSKSRAFSVIAKPGNTAESLRPNQEAEEGSPRSGEEGKQKEDKKIEEEKEGEKGATHDDNEGEGEGEEMEEEEDEGDQSFAESTASSKNFADKRLCER